MTSWDKQALVIYEKSILALYSSIIGLMLSVISIISTILKSSPLLYKFSHLNCTNLFSLAETKKDKEFLYGKERKDREFEDTSMK